MNFESLIEQIKEVQLHLSQQAAHSVNVAVSTRNWLIGCYIVEFEQNGEDKSNYGDRLLKCLEERINSSGMTERRFREFRRLYIVYPQLGGIISNYLETTNFNGRIWRIESPEFQDVDFQSIIIRRMPSAELEKWQTSPEKLFYQLPYSHLLLISKIDDSVKRAFYESEAINGCWSYKELERQINSLYFERSGLSKDKKKLSSIVNQNVSKIVPSDIIKNSMSLEFIGLKEKDVVMESDLETALLDHLQEFLLELGNGFCFEARQKRILIDGVYYKADLVFYHRILKCHVIVELKTDKFKHEFASQLNLYLNYYKNEVMQPNDNAPVGLLLCADYGKTTVRYATAGLDENIFVSKYRINLPTENELQEYISSINI